MCTVLILPHTTTTTTTTATNNNNNKLCRLLVHLTNSVDPVRLHSVNLAVQTVNLLAIRDANRTSPVGRPVLPLYCTNRELTCR